MKDLKLEDYSKIKPYLDMSNYEGYNSNFVTMMMWNHEYHIQYEIHENFLVMLHNYKGVYFWSMPFTCEEYYQEAIDYMILYSKEHEFEFIIDCAIEEFINAIKPIYKETLLFERTPYNDDYIYDREMLQTLSGKKMQKRRNHYNSFITNYPDFEYRDLDIVDDFDIILECLNRWEYEKEDLSESMTSEIRGVMYLLSSKNVLYFEVGGIFIDGKMEAFIIASRLKHSTVQIHVEKANKDIRGLYPAIQKLMLEKHYSDVLYVNREEDMGLENLRKSKRDLHPLKMIKKYAVSSKEINIGQATDSDLDQIKQLWISNFKDEDGRSTDFYFNELYQSEYTYVVKNKYSLISVLQIVPFVISKGEEIQKSYFILGVCTKDTFEGQGYMKQLMSFVLNKYKGSPIYLQAYVPEIYNKFGFYNSHYHQIIKVDFNSIRSDISVEEVGDISLSNEYYMKFTSRYDEYRLRDNEYWVNLIKRCDVFGDKIKIFKDLGYMIYHEQGDNIVISEYIYINTETADYMLSYLKSTNKTVLLECDMQLDIHGEKEIVLTMMSNQNDKNVLDSKLYINEIY